MSLMIQVTQLALFGCMRKRIHGSSGALSLTVQAHATPHQSTAHTFCKLSTKAVIDALMLKCVSRNCACNSAAAALPFAQRLHRALHCQFVQVAGANQQRFGHNLHGLRWRLTAVQWGICVGSVMGLCNGLVAAPCSELFGQWRAELLRWRVGARWCRREPC